MALLLAGILIAQNFGAARQQVEEASEAVSLPVTDLKIAMVLGERLPIEGTQQTTPPDVKELLQSLKASAVQDRSLPEAWRYLLIARCYNEPAGSVLPLARELARRSKHPHEARIDRILSKAPISWTSGEARQLQADLGPAALAASGLALEHAGRSEEASRALERLREYALSARMKVAVSSAALLLVMLGGASAWTLYSMTRRRSGSASQDFGEGAPDAYPAGFAGTMWQTFALYLVVFVLLAAAVSGIASYGGKSLRWAPGSENLLELTHYIVAAAAAFVAAPVFLRSRGLSLRDLGWTSRDWVVDIGWGIGGFLAATALVVVLQMMTSLVLRALGGEPSQVTSPAADFLVGARFGWKLALLLIVVGVVAPLMEETFFRGALLRAAGAEWGAAAAVFVSAIAFAAIHPGIPELLAPYLGIGYVLGKLAVIRKSLLPCFIAHSLNNLFFVGMVMLLQL